MDTPGPNAPGRAMAHHSLHQLRYQAGRRQPPARIGAQGASLHTLRTHAERVIRRWTSTYTNARMEGLNSLFQAARARARSYRNTETFITMIHMIASPAGSVLKST